MADKRIGELPLIEDLDDESFFVAEQQGTDKGIRPEVRGGYCKRFPEIG